jgi:hypothetical protein
MQNPRSKWSYNAANGIPGEGLTLPEEVAAQLVGTGEGAAEFNEGIRESSEIVANVDKGFSHYLKCFRSDQEVTASIRVEQGRHGEYGWGVHFEQGRHRCILPGTVMGTDEDAIWTACAELASFEPVLRQPRIHVEKLWTPDEFGFVFQELETGLGQWQSYQSANPSRKLQIEKFGAGVAMFGQAFEWFPHSAVESGPPVRADAYSHHAAASRRFQVSDGRFRSPGVARGGAGDVPQQGRILGGRGGLATK